MIHDVMTSFRNMSDKEWDQVHEVHLKGAFSCTHAAWPIFRKQKFGRVINTASAAGLFGAWPLLFQTETFLSFGFIFPIGNFGQANYSAAKMGLVGFTKTLALEGSKYNIKVNVIAPVSARFGWR
jgi:multifunctional beta-oxidation protein